MAPRAGPNGIQLRPLSKSAVSRVVVTLKDGWSCDARAPSLGEGGEELLTFFSFPKVQWKTLGATNVIERLHGDSAGA